MTAPTLLEPPLSAVRDVVARALAEDIGPLGDITSSLLPEGVQVVARFVSRAEGVVAGGLCVVETFRQVDPDVRVEWHAADGNEVEQDDVLGVVRGPLISVLTGERTALNLLCHLSGVATSTRRFVRATRGRSKILDTRKTTPGLRALEKAAVRAGGGFNHRGNLSDGFLLKDNHVGGISITDAVKRAQVLWPGRTVRVECENLEQVREAMTSGAGWILLDNMTPEQVAEAVGEVAGRCLIEVSGGIRMDNVGAYSAAGPDFVSVGAITHSAAILDVGLDLERL